MRDRRLSQLLLNPYLISALILAALIAWTFWPRPVPEVGKAEPLPPVKEVRAIEKVVERVKYVKVYPPEVKAKLNLPEPVVNDAAKKVIATGKLDADERPYTMTAVLDTETGDSQVYARPDPLPWIGPGRRGAVRLTQWHDGVTQFDVSHDLLQIKSLHAGVSGMVDTSGERRAGGYVEMRF